jgi:hypothetical protein
MKRIPLVAAIVIAALLSIPLPLYAAGSALSSCSPTTAQGGVAGQFIATFNEGLATASVHAMKNDGAADGANQLLACSFSLMDVGENFGSEATPLDQAALEKAYELCANGITVDLITPPRARRLDAGECRPYGIPAA